VRREFDEHACGELSAIEDSAMSENKRKDEIAGTDTPASPLAESAGKELPARPVSSEEAKDVRGGSVKAPRDIASG
jgi:hypothetical protein